MKPTSKAPERLPDALAGWIPLPEAAARFGLRRETVWRWCDRGILSARRLSPRKVLVPAHAVELLARAWRCPACPFEAADPAPLAAHLRALHADALPPADGWTCPAPACTRGARPFADSAALAAHVGRHAQERKAEGVGDRLGRGGDRPGSGRPKREGPTPTCKADGCGKPAVARGLCPTHYQAARREAKK